MPRFEKLLLIHRCQNHLKDEDSRIPLETQSSALRCSPQRCLHVGQVTEFPEELVESQLLFRSPQSSCSHPFNRFVPLSGLCRSPLTPVPGVQSSCHKSAPRDLPVLQLLIQGAKGSWGSLCHPNGLWHLCIT